ncbi:DUF4870 domain-containing protein [Ekhidna sp.]|uniref:DUF4870 domain-containing protein n=1 Tax=Ekhidna sp. TaxID=2608089 RepID=UPI00329A795D
MSEKYHPIPQPEELTEREKDDAMGSYLMMFASIAVGLPLPIINLIAAIVYYFTNRSKGLFVHFHSLQSLISQLPTTVINAIGVFWAVRIYFFDWELSDHFKGYVIMAIVFNLAYFVFSIVGAVKAKKGRMYYFLFFGRLSYETVFKMRDTDNSKIQNLPPR